MSLNWDAIGGITQIITIIYLIYQFHYLPRRQRAEALQNLGILFEISQKKLDDLIEAITLYTFENKCEYQVFSDGVTFRSQLLQLHHLRLNDLSDSIKENVLRLATTDHLINSAVDSVNKQIFSFTTLEAYFNTTFRFKSL